MKKINMSVLFVFASMAIFFVPNFINSNVAFASSPQIVNFLLNDKAADIIVNPQASGTVSINVTADVPVKFTRLYICSESQACTGSVGAYTKYFTDSATTASITKVWDGKNSAKEIVPEGVYKVRVSMTKEAETPVLEDGLYKIIIKYSSGSDGGAGGDIGDGTGTTTATSTATTTVTTATTTVYVYSTHYVQEEVSTYIEPTGFEVSAGRGRLAYVGSPLLFQAKYKKTGDLKNINVSCTWSFGDGSVSTNEENEHVYKYPGEYNVVLNAKVGNLNSVSRTKVKVLIPDLNLVIQPDGAVKIFNNHDFEINLYGWKLQSGDQVYSFPIDTIISSSQGVIFPKDYTKLDGDKKDLVLINYSGAEIARINLASLNLNPMVSIEEFEKFSLEYKKLTSEPVLAVANIYVNTPLPLNPVTVTSISTTTDGAGEIPLTASVIETANYGFWSKLFHPIRTIKEAFY